MIAPHAPAFRPRATSIRREVRIDGAMSMTLRLAATLGEFPLDVLFVGAGDVDWIESIHARINIRTAQVIDRSEDALERVRRRLFEAGRKPPLTARADVALASWRSAVMPTGFGLVVARDTICQAVDARKCAIYSELAGLLRAGGMLINVDRVAGAGELSRRLHAQSGGDGGACDCPASPVEDHIHWMRQAGLVEADCYFRECERAVLAGCRR